MKKHLIQSLIWLFLLLQVNGFARGRAEINLANHPILDKKLHLNVELDLITRAMYPISDVRIYYRSFSETEFKSHLLKSEGLRYLASVDLSAYQGNMVEYFFAVEYADGSYDKFPEEAPEQNLFQVSLNQDFDSGEGLIVISPEPNDIIYTDEFLLTASFFAFSSRVDRERTKLYLDDFDISRSRFLNVFDDFITFSPKRIPPGGHNLRVELYDRSGRLLTQKQWRFTATNRTGPAPVTPSFQVNGSFFAESRTENLISGLRNEHYNKAGLRLEGSNTRVEFGTRLFVSNREQSNLQPINRYSVWAQTNFWNDRYLRIQGGDTYPQLSPFLLQNVFLRGIHAQLYLKFLNLDFTTGRALRDIEGTQIITPPDTTIISGTFKRDVLGMRASFGSRTHFQFGLTAVKGKDDVNSIRFGRKPEETAAAGADFYLATPKRHFSIEGSFNLSSYNPDILDGKDLPFDSLQKIDIDIDKSLYDFATGIITVNQNLIVLPGIAFQGTARLNALNNNFAFTYKRIENQFQSLGQPFLQRDNKGFVISDNVRLFQNQLFVNLRFQQFENNLNNVKPATIDSRMMSFNVSYFPLRNLPSLTFGFSNFKRDNGITTSANPLVFPEDNSTNTIQFSTSYNFLLSNLRNQLTLNVLNYNRQDASSFDIDNLSNTVSVMLQTSYNIPLKTRLEFNFQQSENTVGLTSSNDLSFNSFGGGVEYDVPKFINPLGSLSLVFNGKYGLVQTDLTSLTAAPSAFDYNRSFLNARVIYDDGRYGRVSLNGDWIKYTGDRSFRDYIVTARYDVNF